MIAFSQESTCIVYGTHLSIVQNMLDYDFLAGRSPSIKAIFSPSGGKKRFKVQYGTEEFFLPTINDWSEIEALGGCDILINLASFRTCSAVNKAAILSGQFSSIFTIAEGVPEQETIALAALAKKHNVQLFGPAIVGAMLVGMLRVGHTGGSLENIVKSRLYQPGSVGIVTKSGGMMNELCRITSKHTDGVYAAFQIGGDRYPFCSFIQIVEYFEQTPEIKIIVLLGEVGNTEELEIAAMIADGRISKPVVARAIGSSAAQLPQSLQFGHAGAKAKSKNETAAYKNDALRKAGAEVPESFDNFGQLLEEVFYKIGGTMPESTTIPDALHEKITQLHTRRPTRLSSSISDERGEELLYNGTPVSTFVQEQSIASVIGHLRLKQELPPYALEFITTILILLADHGPAVSGATNTIITARAGKDCVSSLIAGLATIGPRFGGAITGAASDFLEAVQNDLTPQAFVDQQKHAGVLIQGIGHKVKSLYNPDMRCTQLRTLSESFPSTKYLDFGCAVAAITTQKKPNLILNVDGHIACMLLDMLTIQGYSYDQIKALIEADFFNAFFVLARSIGLLGHHLDQYRLQEGLYRTPWEDILYDR